MEFINYLKAVITVEISIIVLLTTVIIILAIVSFCCSQRSYFIAMVAYCGRDISHRSTCVTYCRYTPVDEIIKREVKNFSNRANASEDAVIVISFNKI